MADSKPLSSSLNARPGGCVALFFSVFLLAGLGFLYFAFLKPLYQCYQARNWHEVPCRILSSEIESHSDSDGTTYKVRLTFQYTANDELYQSSRYEFMDIATSGLRGKQQIVRQFPPCTQTSCFVNPNDPTDAVLKRTPSGAIWFALLPLVFVIIGAGGIILSLRKPNPARERSVTQRAQRSASTNPNSLDNPQAERATLKPAWHPLGKLIGLVFFALFWNGVVSLFVLQVIKSWGRSNGSWMERYFLPVFLIPFVLIGLFVIGAVFHSLLALFNPRTKLTVTPGSATLGAPLTVEWHVSGRASKLTRLRIFLEGREEATYRRGTNTHTDKHVFKTLEIANLTTPLEIRRGQNQVQIPGTTMHSFSGRSNKIAWTIRVKGEIPRWPDIDDEYPLSLLPHSPNRPTPVTTHTEASQLPSST